MTRAELSKFNGQNGQPAYVAVGNVIYDVSASPLWQEGNHEGAHQAGCELTQELKSAPHIAAVIERFPSVAQLEEESEKTTPSNKKLILAVAVVAILLLATILLR
jgi:predicted heme/steroid binding protein